jgi:hypothetical protein
VQKYSSGLQSFFKILNQNSDTLRCILLEDSPCSSDGDLIDALVSLPNLKAFRASGTHLEFGEKVWAWTNPAVCKCRLEYFDFYGEIEAGNSNLWLLEFLRLHSSLEFLRLTRSALSEECFLLSHYPSPIQQEMVSLVARVASIGLMNSWNFAFDRFMDWLFTNFRFRHDPIDDRPLCNVAWLFQAMGNGESQSR